MGYETRAIGYEAPLKTHFPVLMLALSLIASAVRAKIPQEATMNLSSPDFSEGGNIPERFTCEGKDMSPTLKIDGVPKEAKSLVLIVDDPDAPGGNFTHWLMWNVVPDLTEIVANRVPSHAVQGVNDFGKSKYSGPCPPPGIHRYYFKLYALDTTLALPPTSKRKALDSAIKGHIIAEATLMGRYARKGSKRWAEVSSIVQMHIGQVISSTRYEKLSRSFPPFVDFPRTSTVAVVDRWDVWGSEIDWTQVGAEIIKDKNHGEFDKISSFGKWALFDGQISCAWVLWVRISFERAAI
jgi:Raf kinase inhibitor-like YbhB/YbcL family protein